MKKKLFLLPLFAALISTGCSNDEDLAQGGGNNGGTSVGYVAVNIVQPKSMENRAASEGFEYGSTAENEAKEGLFFIFNEAGDKLYSAERLAIGGSGTGTNPEVERIYSTVLVINGVDKDPKDAAKQIVCVLNAPAGLEEGVTSVSLLQGKIADYSNSASGAFIMSNSVYSSEGKIGQTIEGTSIATSEPEARKKAVDIYVERVVAKVRANVDPDFDNETGANPAVDGETKNLKINITGIEVANIAEKSYLFKNVADINYTWAWDATNKRSYWETMPSSLSYANQSYTDIVNGSKPAEGDFDITDLKENWTQYVQPNTSNQKTCILVTAQLKNSDNSPADLAYIRGGYTTKDGAMNVVAAHLANAKGYWKKVADNTLRELEPSDLVWKNNNDGITVNGLERYEVVAQVDPAKVTTLYDRDGKEISGGVDAANEYLRSDAEVPASYRARVFTNGYCYYYVNIDQTPVANGRGANADLGTYEGVVRNHIYDLTLKSIKGIGTPIFDPSDKIIPQRTEDGEKFYLAATVNVLAWRLVKQDVHFDF